MPPPDDEHIDALLAQARQEAARFFRPPPTPSAVVLAAASARAASLSPCAHQAGGHHHQHGSEGEGEGDRDREPPLPASLVGDDASGRRRFFKLLPEDDRARREVAWYGRCAGAAAATAAADEAADAAAGAGDYGTKEGGRGGDPAEAALAQLYREFMPRYHGVARIGGRWLLALDDVFDVWGGTGARAAAAAAAAASGGNGGDGGSAGPETPTTIHRCVLDVKLGRTTAYPWGSPELIAKCAKKDASTTQARLGLRLCGVVCCRRRRRTPRPSDPLVPSGEQRGEQQHITWREDRHWGKALADAADVRAALRRFAALGEEEAGEEDEDEEGEEGEEGAERGRRRRRQRRLQRERLVALAAEVERLRACVARIPGLRLYSASALLLLEAEEEEEEEEEGGGGLPCSRARVALVDFAHAFFFGSGGAGRGGGGPAPPPPPPAAAPPPPPPGGEGGEFGDGPDDNLLAGLDALRGALLGAA